MYYVLYICNIYHIYLTLLARPAPLLGRIRYVFFMLVLNRPAYSTLQQFTAHTNANTKPIACKAICEDSCTWIFVLYFCHEMKLPNMNEKQRDHNITIYMNFSKFACCFSNYIYMTQLLFTLYVQHIYKLLSFMVQCTYYIYKFY